MSVENGSACEKWKVCGNEKVCEELEMSGSEKSRKDLTDSENDDRM